MSGKVKLIIEIPTEMFQEIRDTDLIDIHTLNASIKAIEHGIPLDSVKAEIISKHFSIVEKNDFDSGRTYGYDECLSILDNIGKESEVKPNE